MTARARALSKKNAPRGRTSRRLATSEGRVKERRHFITPNDTWGIRNKEGMRGRNMSIHLI
jgi:hypothetical protein